MAQLDPHEPANAAQRARISGPWLPALLGGGALVLMALLWRLFRAPAELAEAPPQQVDERPADDIWAVAAMLGEAVDRLKQQRVPATDAPVDPFAAVMASLRAHAAMPAEDYGIGDETVLDEVDDAVGEYGPTAPQAAARTPTPGTPSPPAVLPPIVPPTVPPAVPRAAPPDVPIGELAREVIGSAAVPPRHSRSFRPVDAERFHGAAAALLAREPRVLRRPAPRIEVRGGAGPATEVLVEFALLPGREVGEGERILAALQRLARGG